VVAGNVVDSRALSRPNGLVEAAEPCSATRLVSSATEAGAPTVVHVVVAGECGGAERFLVELASRPQQSRARHVVALMTPSDRLARWFTSAGLDVRDRGPVRENPLSYLRRSLGSSDVNWLASIMRREGASVAHLHTFQSHVVGTRAAQLVGARVLRTEHDTRYFVDPSCAPFTRWSLERTDHTVAVSTAVTRFMRSRLGRLPCPVETIRNGVDTERFAAAPLPPAGRPFTFGLLCRLEPVKQARLVLQAIARIGDVRLEVIGDGSELPRLRRQAAALGIADRVAFHGFQKDPREILARIDVLVSASRSESLGLSLLEAQAIGRAVIAFGVGGVPEVIVDGQTGWVVDEHTLGALTTCMGAASRAPGRVREMGERARSYVESEHAIDGMCSAYAAIYARLAARSVGARGGLQP
jgi:glycosyltransferase involved in cell wall biosynthesis